MPTKIDLPHFKGLLIRRQAELEQLAASSAEARAPIELDQQSVGRLSRMDAMQGQAMALETERRRTAEIQRIKAALFRIENDNYGYCATCDEEIALKRLELDPSIPVCIDCASVS